MRNFKHNFLFVFHIYSVILYIIEILILAVEAQNSVTEFGQKLFRKIAKLIKTKREQNNGNKENAKEIR